MKKYLLAFSILLLSAPTFAQGLLDQKVTISIEKLSLEETIYALIDQADVNIAFNHDILPEKLIDRSFRNTPLKNILQEIFRGTPLAFSVIGQQIVLFEKEVLPQPKKYTISGFLTDAATGELLIAASVYDKRSGKGTATNEYGFYSLTLLEGPADLQFSYLGFNSAYKSLNLNANVELNLTLDANLMLEEVIVTDADSTLEVRNTGMSFENIDVKDTKELPKLGGESDIIRTTHLLPGVQTGTDGVGGIYVRGGSLGQNLILIDDVPVYNVSHAAGVFSIFNTDAVRSAKLVKGGFPARYGGRTSAVLDIRTKEGNLKEIKATGNIGLLSASASIEGPMQKDKSSFFISGRGSFINWYLKPASRYVKENQGQIGETSYDFFDFNAKFNFRFTDKDKIYISLYNGSDGFANDGMASDIVAIPNGLTADTSYFIVDANYGESLEWGNSVAAFRWNHLFSNKLFANTTITYSRLNLGLEYVSGDSTVNLQNQTTIGRNLDVGNYSSSIEDFGVKLDFSLIPSTTHYLRFGVGSTRHLFNPGVLVFDESAPNTQVQGVISNGVVQSGEFFAYVEDEMQLFDKLTVNAGLRATSLSVTTKNYQSLEPRLSAYYQVVDGIGLKGSYSKMTQYLHLLTKSTIGLPTDLWVPSTDKVSPEQSWQLVGGIDLDFWKTGSISIEAYNKRMDNLLTYSEGANVISDWEENVRVGSGRSYGLEFLWRQKIGKKLDGWASYTWSRTTRQFADVNQGRTYNYRYDRTHNFKMAFSYKVKKWLNITGNWLFSTGLAYSLPLQSYVNDSVPGIEPWPVTIDVIEQKNEFRMPYYHRLDLSFNFYFKTKGLSHSIQAGVYNLYNRRNPLYYNWVDDPVVVDGEVVRRRRFVEVVLLPTLPSLSYSINF
jgi:outer membrane receptor for ferrienterochelin and colicin